MKSIVMRFSFPDNYTEQDTHKLIVQCLTDLELDDVVNVEVLV